MIHLNRVETTTQGGELVFLHPSVISRPLATQDLFRLLASKGYILDTHQTQQFFVVNNQISKDDTPWSEEIVELETFFSKVKLPENPFYLNEYTPIGNVKKFIEYNLEVAKVQNGNPTYRQYMNRLIELMKYVRENE